MRFTTHRRFDRQLVKLKPAIKKKFKERRDLLLLEPFHPLLGNHPLNPPFAGSRSINVTGDYRAIFKHIADDLIMFTDIGTHHELFGT